MAQTPSQTLNQTLDSLTGEQQIIWRALMDHPNPIREFNPVGRDADPKMVWRCTGTSCDWTHLRAHDGGAMHFAHQAEAISAALAEARTAPSAPSAQSDPPEATDA